MRIKHFKIENYKNIKYAEWDDLPNLIVICGPNGCGKSALLEALVAAKEGIAPYYSPNRYAGEPHTNVVSACAQQSELSLQIQLSESEKKRMRDESIGIHGGKTRIQTKGLPSLASSSGPIQGLSGWVPNDPTIGFFEYFPGEREISGSEIKLWRPELYRDEDVKASLTHGQNKFHLTKLYLTQLQMRELQEWQKWRDIQGDLPTDSLEEFKLAFDHFFRPMKFLKVDISTIPFCFLVETPRGEIDIDDMSSGEKQIFNTLIRFLWLKPKNSVILFDEPELHLHPELQRRYFELLRKMSEENQVWIGTHSPEIMMAAGAESLFSIIKHPKHEGENQFVRVSESSQRHAALCELMGTHGFLSFNKIIVFIEGEENSADKQIFEYFYPKETNIEFVPTGNSQGVRSVAKKINCLLSTSTEYQQFYSITDGDMPTETSESEGVNNRIFRLPVYHVENLLLDPERIIETSKDMLAGKFDLENSSQVSDILKALLLEDSHLNSFTNALLEKETNRTIKEGRLNRSKPITLPSFDSVKKDARSILEKSIKDGTWCSVCKGREVLKAYCGKYGMSYKHFRNLLLTRFKEPPTILKKIMDRILAG